MSRSISILLFALLLLIACNPPHTQIEKAVATAADACPSQDACGVDLATLTDFKWDTLYVFTSAVNLDQIRTITGLTVASDYEFASRLVFTKNGILVYKEERPITFNGPRDGEVVINIPSKANYWVVPRDEAKFSVRREEYRGNVRYMLRVPK
jgi:hypothetical protein